MSNAKAFGNSGYRSPRTRMRPDFINFFVGKLSVIIVLSFLGWMTTLAMAISDIVTSGSNKKMSGINTSWIVAGVADLHPYWNVAIMQFKGESVCRNVFSINAEIGISVSPPYASIPTGVAFNDSAPKSLEWVHPTKWPCIHNYIMSIQRGKCKCV